MTRPSELPDFESPPLNEVVMGVQFAAPAGYQQIRAGEVWSLFREHYPHVEEHQPLPPQFETFGLPSAQQFSLGVVTGASHDRFWFLSPEREQLIQFQNDRLLHNWRKVGNQSNPYPRFEAIIEKFEAELRQLDRYMASLQPQRLKINQSEITYLNHIPCEGDAGTPCTSENWLNLFKMADLAFEDFNCTFRRRVTGPDGAPYARLTCHAAIGVDRTKERGRAIILNLTFRGAPQGDTIEAAIDFLKTGRQMIVEFFAQITTNQAHTAWGRSR